MVLTACCALVSCSHGDSQKVKDAVNSQMTMYPEATLQDLYKAFAQAEFGPEHMITDTTSAGKYLDYELMTLDHSNVIFEPIGTDSSFFRVHLCAVQTGKITRDELFKAFVNSSREVGKEDIYRWREKWHRIEHEIESMGLKLTNYDSDKNAIDSLICTGHYAVHHSEQFHRMYAPHYRIIKKDIFYQRLYDKLK